MCKNYFFTLFVWNTVQQIVSRLPFYVLRMALLIVEGWSLFKIVNFVLKVGNSEPSSNSVWWWTLDYDITIANTAVERSFPLYAHDESDLHSYCHCNKFSSVCCVVRKL